MSKSLLLVTYRGRVTGEEYTTPVAYARTDDEVLVLVGWADKKRWWRNFLEPHPATLRIKGKNLPATGVVMTQDDDPERFAEAVKRYDAKVGRRSDDSANTLVRFALEQE